MWKWLYSACQRLSSPFICSGSSSQPADKEYPQASAAALWVTGYLGACVGFSFLFTQLHLVCQSEACLCVFVCLKSATQKAKFQLSSTEVLVFEHDNSRLFRQTDWRLLFSLIRESISDYFSVNCWDSENLTKSLTSLDDAEHNQCNSEFAFIPVAYELDCHQYISFFFVPQILLQK